MIEGSGAGSGSATLVSSILLGDSTYLYPQLAWSPKGRLMETEWWEVQWEWYRYCVRVRLELFPLRIKRSNCEPNALLQGKYTEGLSLMFLPVLRIHDISLWVRIQIRGSMPPTNGFGSGSFYFHHWTSRHQQKTSFLFKFFCILLFKGTLTSFFKDKK